MKFTAFATGLFCAATALAADTNLYHAGGIDLDKNGRREVYEDPSQPVARRVDDLLSRMTPETCKLGLKSDRQWW